MFDKINKPPNMQVLHKLPFTNITNCCGRRLTSAPSTFEGEDDVSMTPDMLMPGCKLAHVDLVGPYYTKGTIVEFKKISEKVLFVKDGSGDDLSLCDINQGMIGDCWFLSAIDFSINHPKYKSKLKESVSMNDYNKVRVRLYDTASQSWQETLMDTRTLVTQDNFPVTAGVLCKNPQEIWPAMLEKGLAKMCGGYPKIEGGLMSEGMCFLHGGRGFFISTKDLLPPILSQEVSIDQVFTDLVFLFGEGYGVFTAWERDMFSDTKSKGLVDGHAYSILEMKKVDGEWISKLKNPWGKFEWCGRYSDADVSERAQHVKAEFGMSAAADDGVFLMSAYDLLARCEGIDLFEPLDKTYLSTLKN